MGDRYPVDHDKGQNLLETDCHHGQIMAAQTQGRGAQKGPEEQDNPDPDDNTAPERNAVIHGSQTDRISAQAKKRGLRQIDLATQPQHNRETHHRDGIGHSLHQNIGDIGIKLLGCCHIDQQTDQDDISDQTTLMALRMRAMNIDHACHAFSATRSPKIPWGLKTRNITKTKKAKPSL